jgi:hypothetical protein
MENGAMTQQQASSTQVREQMQKYVLRQRKTHPVAVTLVFLLLVTAIYAGAAWLEMTQPFPGAVLGMRG